MLKLTEEGSMNAQNCGVNLQLTVFFLCVCKHIDLQLAQSSFPKQINESNDQSLHLILGLVPGSGR
jgi:hypothetical protein